MSQVSVGSKHRLVLQMNETYREYLKNKNRPSQKPVICETPKTTLTWSLLSHTLYSIYFQLAEEKKFELYFKRTTDRPKSRHFFPPTHKRL